MSYSTPGFSVHHYLPEFAQTHFHWVSDTSQPSHSVSSFSSWPQSFSSSGSFSISQFFSSGGQSIGTSATASVLPMNIQGWFPLRLSDLISLLSKGLSRVFSSTTVQRSHFFFIYLPLIFPTSISSLLYYNVVSFILPLSLRGWFMSMYDKNRYNKKIRKKKKDPYVSSCIFHSATWTIWKQLEFNMKIQTGALVP